MAARDENSKTYPGIVQRFCAESNMVRTIFEWGPQTGRIKRSVIPLALTCQKLSSTRNEATNMLSNHQEIVMWVERFWLRDCGKLLSIPSENSQITFRPPAKLVSDAVKQVGTNNAVRISGMRTVS